MSGKKKWRSFAAWLLAFSLVFGNSSLMARAEEVQTEEAQTEETQTEEAQTEEMLSEETTAEEQTETKEEPEFEALADETEENTDEDEPQEDEEAEEEELEGNYWIGFECDPLEGTDSENVFWTWVFENQSLDVALNTEELEELEDYNIKWNLTRLDGKDEECECVELNIGEDLHSVTLAGVEGYGDTEDDEDGNNAGYANLTASVYSADDEENPIAESSLYIQVRKQVYDYAFPLNGPGEDQMLRYQTTYIEPGMSCYVENASHPWGEDVWVSISDVEVAASYAWSDDVEDWEETEGTVVTVDGNSEEGWNLYGEDFGKADIRITYTSAEDESSEEIYVREVYVNSDVSWLEWDYPEGTDQMLKNSEMVIEGIQMKHSYLNEDDNEETEDVEDFTLSLIDDDGNLTYDEDMVNVEVGEDNRSVTIKSGENDGGTSFYLRGMVDGEEWCGTEVFVNITDAYYNLTPVSVENVQLGEALDLSAVEWKLKRYEREEDGEETETEIDDTDSNYRVRFDENGYDDNVWTVESSESEEELLPSLTRIRSWGTSVRVVAEERRCEDDGTPCEDEEGNEIWEEIAARDLNFDELQYDFEWTRSYGSEDAKVVFTGEPLTLTLVKPENLPEDCRVEWSVMEYDDELGEEAETDSVSYTVNEEENSITLTSNVEEGEDSHWVNVYVRFYYGEAEDCVAEAWADIEALYPEIDYYYPLEEESTQLIGWGLGIDNTFGAWVRNAEYPQGDEIEVTVTDVAVANADSDEKEDLAVLEKREDGNGWDIGLERQGDVIVTLTMEDSLHEDPWQKEFLVHIDNNVISMGIASSTETEEMLPGSSLDLTAYLWWNCYDEEEGEYEKDTDDLLVRWTVESGADYVSIEGDETRTLTVKANDDVEEEWVNVVVRAYENEEALNEGNDCAWADCWIHICQEYYQLSVNAPLYLEPGEELAVSDLGAELKYYSGTDTEGTVVEDVTFDYSEVENIDGLTLDGDTIKVDVNAVSEDDDPRYEEIWIRAHNSDGEELSSRNCLVILCKHCWNEGSVETEGTCTSEGVMVYQCEKCGLEKREAISGTGHQWGSFKTTSAATVFAAAKQTRTCSVCGATETRTSGSKLTPKATLTASSLKMKVKQKTTAFKVTGMANGDYVKSVTSSNTKVVKVSNVKANGTFKLTAQKKTGKATLTITLASGLKKTVKVTVQKSIVKTTKISGLSKKVTVKKGQTVKLSPSIAPVTSQQKVTYTSSNKKVATVTSKGVVKGKKAGKAKITVKSGSKKYVVTVVVK